MACPCNGDAACRECGGTGTLAVTSCPRKQIEPSIWELLESVSFAENGLPPVGGGALDQTQAFLDGYQLVKSHDARWKRYLRA